MKKITIIPYHPNHQKDWNNFVAAAKNATFLFDRSFMTYHQDRFEDASILVFEEDKLLAIFPANRAGDTIFSHQGLSYGGLVITNQMKLPNYLHILQGVLDYYRSIGIKHLVVKQMPTFYCQYFSDEWAYAAFLLNAKLTRVDASAVLDLNAPLNYAKDRKEGVKRGLTNQLKVIEVEDFSDFWQNILIPNLQNRHQVKPVHSLEEITHLKQKFPQQIRQFNVFHQDQLVAGTTIFESAVVAHSQYMSANDERSILGSLDFLHDYLFKEVFQHKRYFDFGISNENGGLYLNQGLNYWKQSFGANICANFVHQIDLTPSINLTNAII